LLNHDLFDRRIADTTVANMYNRRIGAQTLTMFAFGLQAFLME